VRADALVEDPERDAMRSIHGVKPHH